MKPSIAESQANSTVHDRPLPLRSYQWRLVLSLTNVKTWTIPSILRRSVPHFPLPTLKKLVILYKISGSWVFLAMHILPAHTLPHTVVVKDVWLNGHQWSREESQSQLPGEKIELSFLKEEHLLEIWGEQITGNWIRHRCDASKQFDDLSRPNCFVKISSQNTLARPLSIRPLKIHFRNVWLPWFRSYLKLQHWKNSVRVRADNSNFRENGLASFFSTQGKQHAYSVNENGL